MSVTVKKQTAQHYYTESPVSGNEYQVIVGTNNEPAFVLVPYDEYLKIIGADKSDEQFAADLLARGEETFPMDVVKRLADGESPLKVYREYRGLTQAALAEQVGASSIYISQLECRKRGGSTAMSAKLARVLNITLDDLLPV